MNSLKFALAVLCILTSMRLCAQQSLSDEIDKKISEILKEIDIPAVGVVIYKDNAPVLVKGYGYSDREKRIKADANTLFYIASATKAFTAMAAALLDKEGKASLDAPVSSFLKPADTLRGISRSTLQKITVRHLLTHTSGLLNDVLVIRLAYYGLNDPAEIRNVLLNATTFVDTLFNKYRYDNLGYNIYTALLKQYFDIDWKQLLSNRIFKPLGMDHTTTNMSEAKVKNWNVAQPYRIAGNEGALPTNIPKQDNSLQSAGGIFSSLNDLATWLELNIHKGKLKGRQVIPTEIVEKCQTEYATVYRDIYPFTGWSRYGLGWVMGNYQNERVIYHLGGWAGYNSHVSFMPDKKIGIAVATNEGRMGLRVAGEIAAYIYDRLLHPNTEDTISLRIKNELKQRFERTKLIAETRKADLAKRKSTLSLPNIAYEGIYENKFMGKLVVYANDGILNVRLGNLNAVGHFHPDAESLDVELIPGQAIKLIFYKDPQNKVHKVGLDGYEYLRK